MCILPGIAVTRGSSKGPSYPLESCIGESKRGPSPRQQANACQQNRRGYDQSHALCPSPRGSIHQTPVGSTLLSQHLPPLLTSHKHTLNPSQRDTGAQGISGAFRTARRQISSQAGMLEDPGGKLKREPHLWEGADDVPRPTWLAAWPWGHAQRDVPASGLVCHILFCFSFATVLAEKS